jgi:hypothetical protein
MFAVKSVTAMSYPCLFPHTAFLCKHSKERHKPVFALIRMKRLFFRLVTTQMRYCNRNITRKRQPLFFVELRKRLPFYPGCVSLSRILPCDFSTFPEGFATPAALIARSSALVFDGNLSPLSSILRQSVWLAGMGLVR